jgi:hypothetical protein
VVFIAANTMDDLAKEGLVDGTSRVDIARSSIAVGVKAGAKKPDVSTVDALKQTLLNARSIAISAQLSGQYVTNELRPQMGIAAQVMPKIKRIETEPVGNVSCVAKRRSASSRFPSCAAEGCRRGRPAPPPFSAYRHLPSRSQASRKTAPVPRRSSIS